MGLGYTIAAVTDESLWTTGDIAKELGVTTERARQLSHRPDFPAPVQTVRHFRLWRPSDVQEWIARRRPAPDDGT
ncbi:helix-turn-helix domain-containing protein [Frankia sp. CcI49]|uniref:helix-turn-helix transcriptional regulator n=1 Tax=Frankia sp. CcI49 TaxID=1745382 RepID=UPI001F527C78|nr:helix-turn-helix domain-containing protein [Frankia sp. CcI49]